MTDELLVERRDKVLWLTLNRPEVHNALNAALASTLGDALEAASGDETLRAVVLTGAGERSFCSGADLKESTGGMFQSKDGANPIAEVLRAIKACSRVVIARINGSALAGGIGLVAACDLAYAAEHAKFGLPEVRVGLFPMMVAASLMSQMDLRRLQELAYLGDSIPATLAESGGLITRCVPSGELDAVLSDVLARLARGSPEAIAAGKAALGQMRDMNGNDRLAFAEREIAALSDTAEASEGRAAFAERRKPRWAE